MAIDFLYQAILGVIQTRLHGVQDPEGARILDIGAGRGELLGLLLRSLPARAFACDYQPGSFALPAVPIEQVDLNTDALPYPGDSFDLVTCSEVIEHVENYYLLLREAYRVLKKGGLLVVTTPNVLNMKSRLRYFASGFANLFGPLPVQAGRLSSTSQHITPVPVFYLSRALLNVGFTDVRVDIDKPQKTSWFYLIMLYPVWALAWIGVLWMERRKYKTLTPENEPYVLWHGSRKVLTGRTLLVSALK